MPGPDNSAQPAGGDAGEGSQHFLLAFANTLNAGLGSDLLGTREDAAGWLREAALLPAGGGLTGSEHGALLRLRDSLRDVLAAHTDGREDATTAARLTRGLADGRLVLTVDPASAVGLASAARASYSSVVAAVAVAVARSAASGTWLGLKTCGAPGCGQAFSDASGPGTPGASSGPGTPPGTPGTPGTPRARRCPAHA